MGAPIKNATMLAVRLTRSDSATMPRSSGSASPISEGRPRRIARSRSSALALQRPTEPLHVGENGVSGEFQRLDRASGRLGVSAAASILDKTGTMPRSAACLAVGSIPISIATPTRAIDVILQSGSAIERGVPSKADMVSLSKIASLARGASSGVTSNRAAPQ